MVTSNAPMISTLPQGGHVDEASRRAFTLVELMISLFLVLLLTLGINAIFRMSADTVGSGLQLAEASRQLRDARATLERDFTNFADPSVQPALVMQMMSLPSFRDAKDEKSNPAYNRSITNVVQAQDACLQRIDPVTGATVYPFRLGGSQASYIFDNRNHRVDTLGFGMQGTFKRQTGSNLGVTPTTPPGVYQTPFTAPEAWVYYGHLKLLDNVGANSNTNDPTAAGKQPPGLMKTLNSSARVNSAIQNPNNFYASQWVLGRSVILLAEPDATTGQVLDSNGNQQEFFPDANNTVVPNNRNKAPGSAAATYAPLCPFSWSTDASRNTTLYESFCDVGGTTLSDYRQTILNAAYPATPGNTFVPTWYRGLITARGTTRTIPANPQAEDLLRFHGSAFLSKAVNNNMARNVELTAPVFIKGCTQFMVEYAGDYVTQVIDPSAASAGGKPFGAITKLAEDGLIDFNVVTDVNGVPTRQIRWYGLTRSTDGGSISRPTGDDTTLKDPPAVPQIVHPLAAHLAAANITQRLPFEKLGADAFPSGYSTMDSYTCAWSPDDIKFDPTINAGAGSGGSGGGGGGSGGSGGGATNNLTTWGQAFPSHTFLPKLIRITIRVDDPYGRLPDGQTLEFVYPLPQP